MTRRVEGNLQAEVTSFAGRTAELATAKNLLSTTRVLTLTGPGGVGKTRLARRLADVVGRAFPDGVWLVELADVHDAALVPLSVAAALSLHDDTVAPLDGLVDFLAERRLLLIIDNCEHLVGACASLIDRIAHATRDVRIIATSREVLGVAGEQVLPVAPLPTETDALRLLVDRATAANPDFRLTEANRSTLTAICDRLDGMPLALELAALRLRAFTPKQVLSRLDDTLRLLTTGPRTAPERQQTLEAAIRWSYDLCRSDEQRLWEELSVFAGGFDLDAAESVCGALADALSGLVDKSVLRLHGVGRYTMLESLRQFGLARLQAHGDERAVRHRHCDYYRALALRGDTASYWGADDVAWFGQVSAEHANLRAAMQYSLAEGSQAALEIAAGLRPFWQHYRYLLEGYRWLTSALAADHTRSAIRARALSACGFLAEMLSEQDAAAEVTQECAEIATDLELADILAEVEFHSALQAFGNADTGRALILAESSVVKATAANHHSAHCESLAYAFMCALLLDDPRTGEIAARFLAATSACGSHLLHGLALWAVGVDHWRHDELDMADDYLRQAIELLRLFDRCVWIASGLDGLAWTSAARDDYDRAARLMGAASAIRQRSTARLAHTMTGAVGDKVALNVREALGDKVFQNAFNAGAALGQERAVDYALGIEQQQEPASGDVLTRREREVARLVAAGHSNKRIASDLTISVRTAETHVEHILTKLGFTSRAQIATWISGH